MRTNLRTAYDWCIRAAKADRITALGFSVLAGGLTLAWLLPLGLILLSGRWQALVFLPFMGLALSFFFMVPPLLFLLPRLFVWEVRVQGRDLDLTHFVHPTELMSASVDEVARWRGSKVRVGTPDGPFIGRTIDIAVTSASYYRAMDKPDLAQYAQGKPNRWRDVELGLLTVIILGGLFIGLLASSE